MSKLKSRKSKSKVGSQKSNVVSTSTLKVISVFEGNFEENEGNLKEIKF